MSCPYLVKVDRVSKEGDPCTKFDLSGFSDLKCTYDWYGCAHSTELKTGLSFPGSYRIIGPYGQTNPSISHTKPSDPDANCLLAADESLARAARRYSEFFRGEFEQPEKEIQFRPAFTETLKPQASINDLSEKCCSLIAETPENSLPIWMYYTFEVIFNIGSRYRWLQLTSWREDIIKNRTEMLTINLGNVHGTPLNIFLPKNIDLRRNPDGKKRDNVRMRNIHLIIYSRKKVEPPATTAGGRINRSNNYELVRNYGIQDLKMKLSAGYKPEGCNVSTETFHNIFSPTPYFNCPYPNGCSETLWYIGDVKPTLPIGANNIEFLPKDWWPFD